MSHPFLAQTSVLIFVLLSQRSKFGDDVDRVIIVDGQFAVQFALFMCSHCGMTAHITLKFGTKVGEIWIFPLIYVSRSFRKINIGL